MDSTYNQHLQYYQHPVASASSKPRYLKLIFSNEVASPVFTTQYITGKTEDRNGNDSIKVRLVDSNTEELITTSQLAYAKVKIVLLRGDYRGSTTQDFENNILVDWERKKNTLQGDFDVHLKRGCGTVGNISIKQDRNHLRIVKFRLGAKMVDYCPITYVVQEGVTNPFEVKDKHLLPKNSRSLSLNDKVGKLMNISHKRKSKIFGRLKSENIETVKEFLHMHSWNPRKLQEICGVKGKKWEETIKHAKSSLAKNKHITSNSQESSTLAPDYFDGSFVFDNNCYIPQPYVDEYSSIDTSLSIEDYEVSEPYFNPSWTGQHNQVGGINNAWASFGDSVEEIRPKGKKRWMKVLCIFSFSIATFTKKFKWCVGVGVRHPSRLSCLRRS